MTHHHISEACVNKIGDVLWILLQFLVFLAADVVQDVLSDGRGFAVDVAHVRLEEGHQFGQEVSGMSVVDVGEDEVEVLDQLLEGFLLIVKLLGAHVTHKDVHGTVAQHRLGLHGLVQFFVDLQREQKKHIRNKITTLWKCLDNFTRLYIEDNRLGSTQASPNRLKSSNLCDIYVRVCVLLRQTHLADEDRHLRSDVFLKLAEPILCSAEPEEGTSQGDAMLLLFRPVAQGQR